MCSCWPQLFSFSECSWADLCSGLSGGGMPFDPTPSSPSKRRVTITWVLLHAEENNVWTLIFADLYGILFHWMPGSSGLLDQGSFSKPIVPVPLVQCFATWFLVCFWNKVSLCNPDWPQTCGNLPCLAKWGIGLFFFFFPLLGIEPSQCDASDPSLSYISSPYHLEGSRKRKKMVLSFDSVDDGNWFYPKNSSWLIPLKPDLVLRASSQSLVKGKMSIKF